MEDGELGFFGAHDGGDVESLGLPSFNSACLDCPFVQDHARCAAHGSFMGTSPAGNDPLRGGWGVVAQRPRSCWLQILVLRGERGNFAGGI